MNESRAPMRLLLVEDEPTQRLMLERVLTKGGYRVDSVANGKEALERIVSGGYQIVVTDWDMPGLDGPTLCRRVREASLESYVYMLIVTSHAHTSQVIAGLDAGADDYLAKPANEAELLARLAAGARIVRLERSLRDANHRIQELSVRDPLVQTFNRRYLNEHLPLEIERAARYARPLSIAIADLDAFKRVNDDHGHQVGDEVLQHFADIVRGCIRHGADWVARYGGEEFVIVLPETGLRDATTVSEKIRERCAGAPFATSGGSLPVTVSLGVATLALAEVEPRTAAAALLRRADTALYESKRAGRDRVTAAA